MKKVTVWSRLVTPTDGLPAYYAHNHIQDGHVADLTPQPMCDNQRKCWAKALWKKTFALLDANNKVCLLTTIILPRHQFITTEY